MAEHGQYADNGLPTRHRVNEATSHQYDLTGTIALDVRNPVTGPWPHGVGNFSDFMGVYAVQEQPVSSVAQHTPAHLVQPPPWLPLGEASFESTAGTSATGHFAALATSSAHGTSLGFPEGATLWNPYHDYSQMIYAEPVARQDPRGRASRPEGVDASLGCPVPPSLRPRAGLLSTGAHESSNSTATGLESRARGVAIAPKPEFLRNIKARDPKETMTGCIGRVRRRKFCHDERQKVNNVRKQGACLRCRIYKLSCDLGSPCSACTQVKASAKIPRGPCINPRLDTVQAFRAGDGDNRTLVPTLPELRWPQNSRSYQVEVTWDFSPEVVSRPPILQLELSEFEPNGETLAEEWTSENNSEPQVLLLPALACRNTELAASAVAKFLVDCQLFLERTISGAYQDPFMSMTWTEVLRVRQAHHDKTLSNAVRLCTATLMNTEYLMSVDANAFGRPDIPNPPFFFNERSGGLLPPQLTFQLQTIIAMIQTQLQLGVLRDLKRLMFVQNRRVHWRTVFLTIFVLSASLELVYQKQREFVRAKRGISQPYRDNVSYVTRLMMKQWEDAAENLISHYRFVMRGHQLFTEPDGRDHEINLEVARLDGDDVDFIRRIRRTLEARQPELLQSRASRLKNDRQALWAICELFLPDASEITD